jgi:hypothetical protein
VNVNHSIAAKDAVAQSAAARPAASSTFVDNHDAMCHDASAIGGGCDEPRMHDEDEDGSPVKRFRIGLFVVHPSLPPDEITSGLGLRPGITHAVGDHRRPPKGRLLDGVRPDTRWRHSRYFGTREQWFHRPLAEFVEELAARRDFLHRIRATGGEAVVVVEFLGDGYFGDKIPLSTLAMLVDLRLDLGFEVFMVPQNLSGEPDIQVDCWR